MSASEGKGGASPLVWTAIGVLIGVAAGWWYGELVVYTLICGFAGWLVGLALAESGTGADH